MINIKIMDFDGSLTISCPVGFLESIPNTESSRTLSSGRRKIVADTVVNIPIIN